MAYRIPAVLISGIPASGKTCFGEWVKRERGGTHVDLEANGLALYRLSEAWAGLWRADATAAATFTTRVMELSAPAVVSWGYPVDCLPVVRALHVNGLEAWWFDGDRAAAKASFIERATVGLSDHDRQMAGIERTSDELASFYEGRVVRTIDEAGYVPHSDTFERIFLRTVP